MIQNTYNYIHTKSLGPVGLYVTWMCNTNTT